MADFIASNGLRPTRSAVSRPSVLGRIAAALAVWRQRRTLSHLPDHLRADVGLAERDIEREIARPIWDVPAHWR